MVSVSSAARFDGLESVGHEQKSVDLVLIPFPLFAARLIDHEPKGSVTLLHSTPTTARNGWWTAQCSLVRSGSEVYAVNFTGTSGAVVVGLTSRPFSPRWAPAPTWCSGRPHSRIKVMLFLGALII